MTIWACVRAVRKQHGQAFATGVAQNRANPTLWPQRQQFRLDRRQVEAAKDTLLEGVSGHHDHVRPNLTNRAVSRRLAYAAEAAGETPPCPISPASRKP